MERQIGLNFFAHYFCTKFPNLFHNFRSYRSLLNLQITTDCPVLDRFFSYVLFAYLDESMSSIGGYQPWMSWNAVDITQIRI